MLKVFQKSGLRLAPCLLAGSYTSHFSWIERPDKAQTTSKILVFPLPCAVAGERQVRTAAIGL